jgi:hypothetical protein
MARRTAVPTAAALAAVLTGCASQAPPAPERSTNLPTAAADATPAAPAPAPLPPVAPPSPATLDDPHRRAELREAVAAGGAPAVPAALALIDWFAVREALREALAVADAAVAAAPGHPELEVVRARLLLDLARGDEAQAALVAVLAAADLLPAHRLLVDAERARHAYGPALEALERLRSSPAHAAWVSEHHTQLATAAAELRQMAGGAPHRHTPNELLALVRGGDDLRLRRDALRALLGVDAVRRRAIVVGLRQDEPILRVEAVRGIATEPAAADLLPEALADDDARVRAAACAVAGGWRDPQAVPLLLAAMAEEQDGYAFRSAHQALAACSGLRVDLPPDAERSAERRASTLAEWRKAWNR